MPQVAFKCTSICLNVLLKSVSFNFFMIPFKMTDETRSISTRTWMRTIDPINKVGYSDGVVDGQRATYQASFDTGYEQGINFGFSLGVMDAKGQILPTQKATLSDPRRINCQICLNNSMDENMGNLFNLQKDKNDDFMGKNKDGI